MSIDDASISSGDLNKRIILQTPIPDDNDVLESEIEYQDYSKTWAKVEPLSGKQYIEAKKERPELTYQITMRYRSNITNNMRIRYPKGNGKDKFFIIEDIINVLERNEKLIIICYEKVYKDVN